MTYPYLSTTEYFARTYLDLISDPGRLSTNLQTLRQLPLRNFHVYCQHQGPLDYVRVCCLWLQQGDQIGPKCLLCKSLSDHLPRTHSRFTLPAHLSIRKVKPQVCRLSVPHGFPTQSFQGCYRVGGPVDTSRFEGCCFLTIREPFRNNLMPYLCQRRRGHAAGSFTSVDVENATRPLPITRRWDQQRIHNTSLRRYITNISISIHR